MSFFFPGWPPGPDGHSDSSNSGSNSLYPSMMHQSPTGFSTNPAFSGFPSHASPHGMSQSLPGTPGGHGAIDPAGGCLYILLCTW